MALRIFISYRREDASGHAGRLYDSLADHFGHEHVFIDVDTIGLGSDFAEVIEGAVKQCDVVVALMGRQWIGATDAEGRRRLDNPDDFVRLELESAFANDVFVVPTAVQGARLPAPGDLPETLEPLARRQGTELRDTAWRDDVNRLIRRLEQLGEKTDAEAPQPISPVRPWVRRRRRPLLIALTLAVLAGAAVGLTLALGGNKSSGSTPPSKGSAAARRLLAFIPAVTKPSCMSISFGEQSARASLDCSGTRTDATYNLFPSKTVTSGWYVQQRETAGVASGSGGCRAGAFRGEGAYADGRRFCFVGSDGGPRLVWTDARTNVGAVAEVYEGKGPAAEASLLRQWLCCFRLQR